MPELQGVASRSTLDKHKQDLLAAKADRESSHKASIRKLDVSIARVELMKRPQWGTNWSWAALTAEAEGVVDG